MLRGISGVGCLGSEVFWQLDLPRVSQETWLSVIWADVPFVVFLLGVK